LRKIIFRLPPEKPVVIEAVANGHVCHGYWACCFSVILALPMTAVFVMAGG